MKCQNPGCGQMSKLIAVGSTYDADRPRYDAGGRFVGNRRLILLSSYCTYLCEWCGTRMRVLKRHHPDDVQTEIEA